jgi:arylsulfatase A-like enzyme
MISRILLLALLLISPALAKPNILFILVDDMGYGDMGMTGSKFIKTPHLDALAKSGVFCTRGYVPAPVCSPSRAGIVTGRDPRRFGYEGNLNEPDPNYATRPELLGLAPGEHTLGDHLKAAGYATAIIGKWHLGKTKAFHPNQRGFDYFCGHLEGSHTFFPSAESSRIERNGVPVTDFSSNYLTSFLTDDALRFIERSDRKNPWFLFLSYNAPHTPMEATEEDLALYAHIEQPRRRIYAAMMHSLDVNIGRLMARLDAKNERSNTLVVFLSDNGGATNNASWNGPLSGAKGTLLEGGLRVPFFLSWPDTLPAGAMFEKPVSGLDLLPTFLAAAGAEPLPLREPLTHEDGQAFRRGVNRYGAYDGVNLLPALRGEAPLPDRALFWRLQGQTAILRGEDKLITLSHRPAQLFRPGEDPGERNDRAATDPTTLAALFEELGRWQAMLPTVPLWGSSPFWTGESAKIYDKWQPQEEPR